MTLDEAKQVLRENWEEGVECPCCKQYVKLWKRKLNSSMAHGLILISKKLNGVNTEDWFNMEDYFKELPVPATLRGDMPKLRHWGLLEKKDGVKEDGNKNVGLYKITNKGMLFVTGLITVPERSKLYNQKFYGHEGEFINIKTALGNKFNYGELMGTK